MDFIKLKPRATFAVMGDMPIVKIHDKDKFMGMLVGGVAVVFMEAIEPDGVSKATSDLGTDKEHDTFEIDPITKEIFDEDGDLLEAETERTAIDTIDLDSNQVKELNKCLPSQTSLSDI